MYHFSTDGSFKRVHQFSRDTNEVMVVGLHLVELLDVGGSLHLSFCQLQVQLLYCICIHTNTYIYCCRQ